MEINIPEFLTEMSKQMNSDPSRMTSHPFWQVRCKRYLATADDVSVHHYEVCGDDGVIHKSSDPIHELHEYLLTYHEDWCKEWASENHEEYEDFREAVENYFDVDWGYHIDEGLPEGYRVVAVQEVEEVITTHLTQAGALAFIARKQHDYPELYTWVESAYWSPQLRELQDWIKSLTA